MYQELEHWKQYKQEKDLQTKIAKEFELDKAIAHDKEIDELCTKEMNAKEFDKQLDKITKKYFPNE